MFSKLFSRRGSSRWLPPSCGLIGNGRRGPADRNSYKPPVGGRVGRHRPFCVEVVAPPPPKTSSHHCCASRILGKRPRPGDRRHLDLSLGEKRVRDTLPTLTCVTEAVGSQIEVRKPRKIFIVLGVSLAMLFALFLFRGLSTKPGVAFPSVGTPAPAFSLLSATGIGHVGTPADGGRFGMPFALLFFGAWCSLCHGELPPLAKAVHDQQAGANPLKRVAVVGVDSVDSPSEAAAFARSSGVTFPVGSDGDAQVTSSLYGFTGDPYAVFVSGNGMIVAIHRGPLSVSQFISLERNTLSI